jgi:hypothetical protein
MKESTKNIDWTNGIAKANELAVQGELKKVRVDIFKECDIFGGLSNRVSSHWIWKGLENKFIKTLGMEKSTLRDAKREVVFYLNGDPYKTVRLK